VAEAASEGEADPIVDVDLVDAVHLVFDRVFDCDDLAFAAVDAFQGGVRAVDLPEAGWVR
jgi:hypothetical protein